MISIFPVPLHLLMGTNSIISPSPLHFLLCIRISDANWSISNKFASNWIIKKRNWWHRKKKNLTGNCPNLITRWPSACRSQEDKLREEDGDDSSCLRPFEQIIRFNTRRLLLLLVRFGPWSEECRMRLVDDFSKAIPFRVYDLCIWLRISSSSSSEILLFRN